MSQCWCLEKISQTCLVIPLLWNINSNTQQKKKNYFWAPLIFDMFYLSEVTEWHWCHYCGLCVDCEPWSFLFRVPVFIWVSTVSSRSPEICQSRSHSVLPNHSNTLFKVEKSSVLTACCYEALAQLKCPGIFQRTLMSLMAANLFYSGLMALFMYITALLYHRSIWVVIAGTATKWEQAKLVGNVLDL